MEVQEVAERDSNLISLQQHFAATPQRLRTKFSTCNAISSAARGARVYDHTTFERGDLVGSGMHREIPAIENVYLYVGGLVSRPRAR